MNYHRFYVRTWRPVSLLAMSIILALVIACGPGQEPTPTPTSVPKATAVPTATTATAPVATSTAAPLATPTPTRPGPIATPTATSVAAPSPTPTPGIQPKKGGVVKLVYAAYPPSYDQQFLTVQLAYGSWLPRLYNNLMANYEGNKVECEVCADWHLENSGKTMVFNLLPGIKFHNGKEMTSADLAYSLKMIMGQIDGLQSPRSGIINQYIESIETPSKTQLVVRLVRPSEFVPTILSITTSAIYPEGTTRDDLAKKPAGSGPFVLAKAVPGAGMIFERNPSYFKPGLPYLDGIEVTLLSDLTAQAAALLTHKIEYLSADGETALQIVSQYKKLVAESKMKTVSIPRVSPMPAVYFGLSKPPLNNLKLRQAINLALDRADIGQIRYGTKYVEHLLLFNPGDVYGTPKEKIWDIVPGWGTGAKKLQEVEQAKQLVKDAGYPDGIDVLALGRTTGWNQQIYAEEVQRQLAKVNIRVKFELYDVTTEASRFAAANYQLHPYNYKMTTNDPDEVVGQYWITGGPRNDFAYSNPEVDRLFIAMSSEQDLAKRKALFLQIQDIIVVKDVALAPTPSTYADAYWWNRLQGFTVGFSGDFSSGFWRGDRLWLQD
ncbi:MAG: ABC transporter substrate-binding protein [Dehalococcoidia bacterium]|nr:ABC transporter substrate-binding protein [Dehalococcoidia bacterium]